MQLKVQFKRATSMAPTLGSASAAGFDLYAATAYIIDPGRTCIIQTGTRTAIPTGYVGLIRDRSSLHKIGMMTLAGVIDADYRGEIGIVILNFSDMPTHVKVGQRLAQLVVVPCLTDMEIVDEFSPTQRGNSGFGSTGI